MANLRSDALGRLGAAVLGVVMLSPAMTLYGGFGAAFLSAGNATPLAYFFAFLMTIPTATSYALLASRHPHSGSASHWTLLALNKRWAVWVGWMAFMYYFTNFLMNPVTLGGFFADLVQQVGGPSAAWVYIVGVFICSVWAGSIVFRGINISSRGAFLFLFIEITVVLGLCLTVLIQAPAHGQAVNFSGFHIASSPTGFSGILKAMIFGVLAYCGFDVVSTLAEETKLAKKFIPEATLLALILFALFIIFGSWALSFGEPLARIEQIANSGSMPISVIANDFWGKGAVLVSFTAISASLGLAVATAVGASRILFSMGRSGLAPAAFADLDSRFQVPWRSLILIFVVGTLLALVWGYGMGAFNAYVWWGTASTFFAMITYLFVNLAALVLHRHEIFKNPAGFFLFGLIPALGISANFYLLIRAFFIELWDQGWSMGQSVIVFDLVCAAVAGYAAWRIKFLQKV